MKLHGKEERNLGGLEGSPTTQTLCSWQANWSLSLLLVLDKAQHGDSPKKASSEECGRTRLPIMLSRSVAVLSEEPRS